MYNKREDAFCFDYPKLLFLKLNEYKMWNDMANTDRNTEGTIKVTRQTGEKKSHVSSIRWQMTKKMTMSNNMT